MRITWSTVLCAAAVFVLLLSGDEPGDGVPAGPHLSKSVVEADLSGVVTAVRAPQVTGLITVGLKVSVKRTGKPLPAECFAGSGYSTVTNTPGNYTAVVRALVADGWHIYRRTTAHGLVDTGLSKGGWDLSVSRSLDRGILDAIVLYATDTTC